jgi:hypothetical protein
LEGSLYAQAGPSIDTIYLQMIENPFCDEDQPVERLVDTPWGRNAFLPFPALDLLLCPASGQRPVARTRLLPRDGSFWIAGVRFAAQEGKLNGR